jgi:hypothetical protein
MIFRLSFSFGGIEENHEKHVSIADVRFEV